MRAAEASRAAPGPSPVPVLRRSPAFRPAIVHSPQFRPHAASRLPRTADPPRALLFDRRCRSSDRDRAGDRRECPLHVPRPASSPRSPEESELIVHVPIAPRHDDPCRQNRDSPAPPGAAIASLPILMILSNTPGYSIARTRDTPPHERRRCSPQKNVQQTAA